tara:strand:+ start:154 stop:396 length:243 start_codon:yes stop_codon:yes gene_type:complete
MKISIIEENIKKVMPNSIIKVIDTNGTGDHFSVMVVSDLFDGLTLVDRHKLIYKALNKYLNNQIHALQIKTITNKEYDNE